MKGYYIDDSENDTKWKLVTNESTLWLI